jgi:two-component system sensor histidine kinase/response regulator
LVGCSELRTAITTAIASQGSLEGRAAAPAGPSNLIPKNYPGSKLHVLLAEDNSVKQRVALRILEKAGHSAVIAENGRVALRMLEEQGFDLILMDVQMPEMDGFQTTALIRALGKSTHRHIPIIAMTAHAMAGGRERCLAAGMDNYISKPITAAALLEIVAHYGGLPIPFPVPFP